MGPSYINFTEHTYRNGAAGNGLTINVMLPDYIQDPDLVMPHTMVWVLVVQLFHFQ